MNIAFYTGVSGMVAFQQQMDVTAHNISNSTTPGFKVSRSSFSDLMYTAMDVRTPGDKVVGHGVKNGATDLIMSQSGLNMTGKAFDFALVGDGFFALEDGNGQLKYTRNGSFGISVEGNKGYLVSSLDGSYVLDNRGRQIALTPADDGVTFSAEGVADRLGVYTFSNPYGLARANGSSFTETDNSGPARAVKNNSADNPSYIIKELSLEFSASNLGDEMINVIQSQRAFQMNSKIVQTADQMEEMINNLR